MNKILLYVFLLANLSLNAQVYPFTDDFESYTNFTVLGTQGGYKSDMSVYQTHGMGNSPKGLVSQISQFNTRDTLVSPLIGQVGASAQLSFFYRVINTSLYPSTPTVLGAGDAIEIYAGIEAIGAYQLMYTINNTNHVTDTAFKKVKINIPGTFVGQTGNFKFVVKKGTATDYWVDIDSLRFEDSTVATPPVLTTGQAECLCYQSCNGSVFVTATGGNPPYTYLWNTGSNNDTLYNQCAANYSVTVTDAANLSVSATQAVYEPSAVFMVPSNITPIPCHGGTGCINLRNTTYGGHAPYDYIWSNNAIGDSICGLIAGIYDVTILDANNCSGTGTYTMIEPDSLLVTYNSTNPTTNSGNDGLISLTATGGAGYYSYSLNGGAFETFFVFDTLTAGCYAIITKDNNGCTVGPDTICLIDPPSGIQSNTNAGLHLYPNPATDWVLVKTDFFNDSDIELLNVLGEIVLKQSLVKSETRIYTGGLPTGNYWLRSINKEGVSQKKFSVIR